MVNDEKLFAFVLMPFQPKFDDIYKLGIKETATALDIVAERVDEQIFREGILDRIYRQIELADIVVADMSDQNPNVFYEVGYAHAKNKICILLTQRTEDIPFDLKHHRHIVYGSSIGRLRTQLTDELTWARAQIETMRSSRIKVSLNADGGGLLEKSKYAASGKVNFKLDLQNDDANASAEIDAIYFYANRGWRLRQDGKECSSTDSDLSGFGTRYFLTPPVRRLNRNSWAQVKFTAERTLAFATRGQEFKDEYRITGRSLIRLLTAEGNFDYDFPLDVTIDEIPF